MNFKRRLVLILGTGLFFGLAFQATDARSGSKKRTKKVPFGCWMRSQEEDKDPNASFLMYRPCTYNFPPARGRSGFILNKNGRFAIIKPSALDGRDTLWGSWEKSGPNSLKLQVKGTSATSFSWTQTDKQKIRVEIK